MSESAAERLEALRQAIDRLAQEGGPELSPDHAMPGQEELRRAALKRHLDSLGGLAGQRVLHIGGGLEVGDGGVGGGGGGVSARGGQGADALIFAARGAEYVLSCTQPQPQPQLRPQPQPQVPGEGDAISAGKEPRMELRSSGWETLDPQRDGTFELVHCHGLLHRVLEPTALLRTLRRLAACRGTLLISSMMLADPERSEYLRFVPDRHAGDPPLWFIPGRLALRWMVQTAGFDVEAEFGESEGPREGFPVLTGYLRARAAE